VKRYVGKLVEQDADGNPIGDPFPEAKERAARIIAESRATNCSAPRPGQPEPLTVRRLAKSYLDERACEKSDDQLWHDQRALADAIELYGSTKASQFGPLALRSVRKLMIDSGRLNRRTINDRVARIVAAFAWAVSFEMIASEVLVALQTVKGLRAGRRDGLREPTPVRPVEDEDIEAVLPLLSPQLAAIIQVMRHSGARCGEVIQLRPCDLEQTDEGLLYRPPSHKNAHRGQERVISLGPRAAQALKPFLLRPRTAALRSSSARLRSARLPRRTARHGRASQLP
jgi:integrase